MKRSDQFLNAMEVYDSGDEVLALQLMMQCTESGDPIACYTTALWYKNGEGAPADAKQCTYWLQCLQQIAEEGDVVAQYQLNGMYRWGDLLQVNIEAANYWLECAADGAYGEAQHHLAWYYEFGQYDYPVDKAVAESWYQRALQQGNPETFYLFAIRQFKDGKPTEAALRLLRKAADKGFKQAEHVLNAVTH